MIYWFYDLKPVNKDIWNLQRHYFLSQAVNQCLWIFSRQFHLKKTNKETKGSRIQQPSTLSRWIVSCIVTSAIIVIVTPRNHICVPLSQNEHKVATAAIENLYRFKFLIMQALKWYMICGYSSLFCPAKINILCWFSFVFYCFVTCFTGYISVCNLATLHSFCGSRSHIKVCSGQILISILASSDSILASRS